MKSWGMGTLVALGILFSNSLLAQCSICTKTAGQLGEGPASSLNSAIIYLALAPFAIVGYFGWRWWKNEKKVIVLNFQIAPYGLFYRQKANVI
jgi:hypothetical protein